MAARRRKLFIVVPLLISCGIIAGAAISYAVDDGPQPLTADEMHDDTVSLEEVAAASSGKPGEAAPCPDAKSIQEQKEADLEFGPCNPPPEEAQVIILREQPDPGEESDAVEQCPIVGGSKAAHELNVGIACAKGARLVGWISTRNAANDCIKVSYVPEARVGELTEVLCPGDVPAAGGTPMGELDSYRVIGGEWVRHG